MKFITNKCQESANKGEHSVVLLLTEFDVKYHISLIDAVCREQRILCRYADDSKKSLLFDWRETNNLLTCSLCNKSFLNSFSGISYSVVHRWCPECEQKQSEDRD